MVKHYTKKGDIICAAQWTGTWTDELKELLGDRQVYVEAKDRFRLTWLNLGSNRMVADVGDWIVSSGKGKDIAIVTNAAFRDAFEEVTVESNAPTADAHEAAGRAFVVAMDKLILESLKLTREDYPQIFHDRDRLARQFRELLRDHAWHAAEEEKQRLHRRIDEVLR